MSAEQLLAIGLFLTAGVWALALLSHGHDLLTRQRRRADYPPPPRAMWTTDPVSPPSRTVPGSKR